MNVDSTDFTEEEIVGEIVHSYVVARGMVSFLDNFEQNKKIMIYCGDLKSTKPPIPYLPRLL